MIKVELRMNEDQKYEIIKKLVECNGNKKTAALKIGCTPRNVNRLIQGYKREGKAFFVHGNRGKKPIHTLSHDTKSTILGLYNSKYPDANFAHYTEILAEHEGIFVSPSTIKNILV